MEISLPPAKWSKAVGRIAGTGTSGWDWLPPPDRAEATWVNGTTNAEPGDLFLSYEVGKQGGSSYGRPTILWMAIPVRGSLLYLAETASDKTWAIKLLGITRSLLGMSDNARVLFGLDRRLEELRNSRDRSAAAESAISEVMVLRQRYLDRLRRPAGGNATEDFIKAAFERFLIEQSSLLNKARDDLLLALQMEYKQLENVPHWQSRNQQPLPETGRRNIQFRRNRNV